MTANAERLREARKRAGFTSAVEAAASLGVAYPTYMHHENGTRGFTRHAAHYARRFRVSLDWLLSGKGELPEIEATEGKDTAIDAPPLIALPRSLPILGTAAASITGAVTIGLPIGYQLRPPSLLNVPDAYALYVAGDSMEPRFCSGDLVYINPHRPYRQGDDVVVQLRLEREGEITGYVKRFLRRNATGIICQQFNPALEIEYRAHTVLAVHRVLTAQELMQV